MKKGFTILELLVVIGLVAVLAFIIMASLGGAKRKAQDAQIEHQVSDMRSQAALFRGTPALVSGTVIVTPIIPVSGGNLFTADDASQYSLLELINGMPKDTTIYYASDAVLPSQGGKWIVIANTSSGSLCVDWSGYTQEYVGVGPTTVSGFTTAFPLAPSYSCLLP